MEYVLLILTLAIVGGCAIGGYGLLDAVERDEDQDRARVAGSARAAVLVTVPTPLRTVSAPRPSSELWFVRAHGRSAGSGSAEADRLDARIRGLEQGLDRLERACRRVEASRQQGRRNASGVMPG